MDSSLSEKTISEIATRVSNQILTQKMPFWVDPETHLSHHDWIRDRIISDDEWRRFRVRVLQSAVIYAVPICLTFIGYALWQSIKVAVQN